MYGCPLRFKPLRALGADADAVTGRFEFCCVLISKVLNTEQTPSKNAILFDISGTYPGVSVTERPVVLPPAKAVESRHGQERRIPHYAEPSRSRLVLGIS